MRLPSKRFGLFFVLRSSEVLRSLPAVSVGGPDGGRVPAVSVGGPDGGRVPVVGGPGGPDGGMVPVVGGPGGLDGGRVPVVRGTYRRHVRGSE